MMWPFGKSKTRKARQFARMIRAKYDAAVTNADNIRHWANADGLSADAAASPDVRQTLRNRSRYEVATGADTALTVDGLTQAEVTFGEQVKPNGRPLGIPASLLLVPTALKVPAELLMTALLLNETTTTNKAKPASNPHTGKFDVVSSVYLSNPSFTGACSKAWYLLADPNRLPALEVAFLNGIDRPTVEKTDADFNTLGIQFRGYIDFGVREQDYRGALRMKGEA